MEYNRDHLPETNLRAKFVLEFYRDKDTQNHQDKDLVKQALLYFGLTPEQGNIPISKRHTFNSYIRNHRLILKRKGYLKSISYNNYEITEEGLSELVRITKNETNLNDNSDNNININSNSNPNKFKNNILVAEREVGTGSESIYVFSYPTHRKLAEKSNKSFWLHKIGRTGSEDLVRVLDQTNTAVPEKPEILLHIRTDSSSLLEKALHSILKLRGKHNNDSPGTEWFRTNCAEIEEIYLFIMNIKK